MEKKNTKEMISKKLNFLNKEKKIKVLVAMSGGVDSSVVAALLKEQGYFVAGAHIKAWALDEKCATADVVDARRTAEALDIPFYIFDFEKEYKEKVVDYFVKTYADGRTPNPDVLCNSQIKFGVFLEKAQALGFDFIATGHYARAEKNREGFVELLKGRDSNKDQSYFLWQLNQDQLKRTIFPLGDYEKKEIRELARYFNLPTAEKKDSQGICFLGFVEIKEFLRRFLKIVPGPILLPSGEIVGEHEGAVFYTIGQRHGFNLASSKAGLKNGAPLFIVGKDITKNTLTVASGHDNPLLWKKIIWLDQMNFIGKKLAPIMQEKVEVAIRYRQAPQEAVLFFDKIKNLWRVDFKESVWAVAIGQHAVFYQDDNLIGGGVIVGTE